MADLIAGHVYIAPLGTEPGGQGWTDIGATVDGFTFRHEPPADDPVPVRLDGLTVSATVDYSGRAPEFRRMVRSFLRLIRASRRQGHQRKHYGRYSRCRTCHPEQDRRPLPVNGHAYHRRQLARVRRKR